MAGKGLERCALVALEQFGCPEQAQQAHLSEIVAALAAQGAVVVGDRSHQFKVPGHSVIALAHLPAQARAAGAD
jgi:hypothetical protein